MSTSTALTNIREKLKAELATLRATVPAPTGRTISVRGKIFTFPDGKTSQGPITAVILDHRNFYSYYTRPYDQKNPVPPQCFAISKALDDLAPHKDAKDPQAADCATCTWNKWGSAPTGKGKACRNTVRIAIAPPDAKHEDEPYILKISPTGLKQWAALCNGLETRGLLPIQVATEIGFDANQAYPTLVLRALAPIPEGQLEVMWTLREKAQILLDQTPALSD